MAADLAKPDCLALQASPQELRERWNIRFSGDREPVSLLESFQRLLGGGSHLAIDRAGIMASSFECTLQAFDKLR
jgi:hypothetical protein